MVFYSIYLRMVQIENLKYNCFKQFLAKQAPIFNIQVPILRNEVPILNMGASLLNIEVPYPDIEVPI
jgi:hypothetical protein